MFSLKSLYRSSNLLRANKNSTQLLNLLAQQQPAMISTIQNRSFSAFVNHRDTEDNSEETPFEFTKENYEAINQVISKYPTNYKHSAVIPLLFIAQKQNANFLTLSAMNKISKILDMAPM